MMNFIPDGPYYLGEERGSVVLECEELGWVWGVITFWDIGGVIFCCVSVTVQSLLHTLFLLTLRTAS